MRRGSLSVMLTVFVLAGFGAAGTAGASTKTVARQQCDTSWKAPVDGNWADASKWTNGVPDGTAASAACITKSGTYTVDVTGGAYPRALTLGGSAGRQTVSIDGSCNSAAGIDIGESGYPREFGTIGANATVRLTDTGCNAAATLEEDHGTLKNLGTIEVDAASIVTTRRLWGNIVNKGTVRLGAGSQTQVLGGIVDTAASVIETHLGAGGGGLIVDSEPGVRLDGTLAIVADPGFVATSGYHFSVCTNCPGRFANVTGQTLSDHFVVRQHYHSAPDGYPTVELKIRRVH